MAATLEQIEKLLAAGYSKEEIEKITAEQKEPEEVETPEGKEVETPEDKPEEDPFIAEYKEKIAGIYDELKKATEEIQKFNIRHSQQPEVERETAGDILFNSVATIMPPPGKEKE